MSETIKMIAQRIRELREIAGYTVEELAEKLNLSLDVYLEYESGNVDIPVSVLYELASIFKVELTELLTGERPHLRTWCLVRKGRGVDVERRKEYKYTNLAYNFKNKKSEPMLVVVNPEPADKPLKLNFHPGQEFNYVLEGRLMLYIEDKEFVMEEGDSIYFDSTRHHTFRALDDKPAKLLVVIMA